MDREPVKSRSVASVGYNDLSETLEIEFRNGSLYRYHGVREQTYFDLMAASSIGRFVNYKIKPFLPYERIAEERISKGASNSKSLRDFSSKRKTKSKSVVFP